MVKMKKMHTRKNTEYPLFGRPQELSLRVSPTYDEVHKAYLEKYDKKTFENDGFDASSTDVMNDLAIELIDLWKFASIPPISRKGTINKIKKYHDEYKSLMKNFHTEKSKNNDSHQNRLEKFQKQMKTLFDISACKCSEFSECKCEKSKKVPFNERNFLKDQRSIRKMVISSIDQSYTTKLKKRLDRKMKSQANSRTGAASNLTDKLPENSDEHTSDDESDRQSISSSDEHEPPKKAARIIRKPQNRQSLNRTAEIADRYNIPDRAAAALTTSVLEDYGIVTSRNSTEIIDKNKLRREKENCRDKLQKKSIGIEVRGLYFDGRKDDTLIQEKIGDKFHRRKVKEEHISLVKQPGDEYLGHTTPTGGTAREIADSIIGYLDDKIIRCDLIRAIGCDSTAVNTGYKGGVIRLLEMKIEKEVQWCLCLLHGNELPFRHLFQYLDGPTSGPTAFSGLIGKDIPTREKRPVIRFQRMNSEIPDVDEKVLSTDQKYMYRIANAIISGDCPEDLAEMEPGNLNHSRWLTTCNRVFRDFISNPKPSANLITLVTFLVKVYVPIWFAIKTRPFITDGARHVHKMIVLSRYLSSELKAVIDPVIEHNAYYAHPENLLLSMLTDERQHIRQLAYSRIQVARQEKLVEKNQSEKETQSKKRGKGRQKKTGEAENPGIRFFKIPKINFDQGSERN